jgi:hypothetical protein
MTRNTLNIIKKAMEALGLEYGFMRYNKKPVPNTYWVGEYQETAPDSESGHSTSSFLLTGCHRGTWDDLETQKERIANYFNKVSGKTVMAEDGSAVAIFYSNSLILPTMDAELKRIQINLDVHEWSVK